ncbi:hypothetical protein U8335_02830 [Roseiconus lacunae]|uniref:hypothetical protein n=1 Tax=Roseiconus lacunae TaxID=2605694 RepID=UPI001E47FF46|nr:hypothetical protein [Roseiconus lacunae]MCD0461359.1 hypothetical protein [Roseiconus lacunae]WRQ51479.1 hypothetical protein U8335_02830 [Stieleria sp. HD01]
MLEPSKQPKNDTVHPQRRASDRGNAPASDRAGGRRQSDRKSILPRSKFGLALIALSYLFSITLLAFAFTSPFRRMENRSGVDASQVSTKEYEAQLPAEEYIQYARQMDDRLKSTIRERQLDREADLPDKREVAEQFRKRAESRKKILRSIYKEAGKEGLVPKTIQWDYAKELEKVADDAPLSE